MTDQEHIDYLNRVLGQERNKYDSLHSKIDDLYRDLEDNPELSKEYIIGRIKGIIEVLNG